MPSKKANSNNSSILLVNRLLITDEDNRLLVIQRASDDRYRPNEWEFPGGKLELSEDISSSIHKEVSEETGLDIRIQNQIAYVESYIIPEGRYKGRTYVGIFGTAITAKPGISLSSEHQAYSWVNQKSCTKNKLTPECDRALQHLFNRIFNP